MVSFALLLVVGGAIAITVQLSDEGSDETHGGAKSAARKGEGIDLEKPSSTQPSSSPSSDSTDAPLETEMTSKFDTKTSGEEETTTNTETVDIDITTEYLFLTYCYNDKISNTDKISLQMNELV